MPNNISDFEALLLGFGQTLNEIDILLLDISGKIVDDMKSKSPIKTGALKKSITSIVSNKTLTFNMLVYGAFQNYGVNGTNVKQAKQVQFGVEPRPLNEPFYAFKSRRFGLKSRDFFDIDEIIDRVSNELGDKIIAKIN